MRARYLTVNGRTRSIPEWSRYLGVPKYTLFSRFRRGWSASQIITEPIAKPRSVQKGDRFGRWTVIRESPIPRRYQGAKRTFYLRMIVCRCDCGIERSVQRHSLVLGLSVSCGCGRRGRFGTHNKSLTKIYGVWTNMWARCRNPRNPSYPNYGGRGIKVCKRWEKFENFLADMGEPPKGLSIDRKNNELGYSPENCRWTTRSIQNGNKRRKQK